MMQQAGDRASSANRTAGSVTGLFGNERNAGLPQPASAKHEKSNFTINFHRSILSLLFNQKGQLSLTNPRNIRLLKLSCP